MRYTVESEYCDKRIEEDSIMLKSYPTDSTPATVRN